jgi:hypothetical protein
LTDVLGDAYALGTAVTMTTHQAAQVAGFVAGGAAVGAFGARAALLADAGTSWPPRVCSRWGYAAGGGPAHARAASGARPDAAGVAVGLLQRAGGYRGPLTRAADGGPVAAVAVMAAPALGAAARAVALARLAGPDTRKRLTSPLAFGACSVLALAAVRPGLPGLLVILLVAGLCDSYQVQANAAFVAAVPDGQRAQAFGVEVGGMQLGQGGGDDPGRGRRAARRGSCSPQPGPPGRQPRCWPRSADDSGGHHPHPAFRFMAASIPICPGIRSPSGCY